MSDAQIVDLDALVPKPVTIKLGEQEIEIQPPKTADVLRLGVLGQEMENIKQMDDAQLDKLVADITAQLVKVVPEIGERQLSMAQLLKLVEIVSEMGVPPDAKAARDAGVSPNSPKKTQ